MTAVQVATRRVTLVHAGQRTDVSVPEGLHLGEVADAVGAGPGLYLGRLALMDGSGTVLDPRGRVADAVESGAVLWLVDAEALLVPEQIGSTDPSRCLTTMAMERLQLGLLGIAVAAALGAAYISRMLLPRANAVGWDTIAVSAILAAVGVALATRPGTGRVERLSRWAAPAFGLAAGFAFPFTTPVGSFQLAVTAAFLVAATTAALARVQTPDADGVCAILVLALSAAGLACVLGVLLDWPAHVAGALLAGISPLLLRWLPSRSLEVPDDELVDTERFATTVWTARLAPLHRRRSRVQRGTVAARVSRAKQVMATGTLAVGVATTAGLAALLASVGDASGLVRWASVVFGLLLVASIGLQSRTVRDRTPKVALQLATAVLLLEVALALHTRVAPTTYALLLGLVVALAVVGLGSAVALARGWRSVRLSRFADLFEGLAVAFVLPCALLSVDAIETFRRLTSG